MEDVKNKICNLCFQLINNDISIICIGNVNHMVKSLLPDNDVENSVICHSCVVHLKTAYNFMRVANENNLKILDATIENDDDLCQTCLKPIENTHVYLYNCLDNVAPLPLIKWMLECLLIILNLEYRRYPVMCDDCWKILKISYSFLMCCVQNEKQIYREHNYTLIGGKNIKQNNILPYPRNLGNINVQQTSMEKMFSDLETEVEPIFKQEIKEEPVEQDQFLNNASTESISSDAKTNQDRTENATLPFNSFFMVGKYEFEGNLDCLMEGDCDVKPFEEINITGDKITSSIERHVTENDNKIGEKSREKQSLPDYSKKVLYVEVEKFVPTESSLMGGIKVNTRMYQCHLCPYSTKKKYKHTRHLTTHMTLEDCAKNNTLYKCNNCNYMTKLKYSLRRHMKQVHRSEYICQMCNYETNETNAFTLHIKSEHNNNQVAYNCDKCSYSCFTKLQLKHHVKTHNLDKIILKCSQCVFETKEIIFLHKHMMSHKDMRVSKLYKCEICSYEVKKKSGISRHILTHSTKKELSNSNTLHHCYDCSYKTKRKDTLVNHIRIRHKKKQEIKKEKPCICIGGNDELK